MKVKELIEQLQKINPDFEVTKWTSLGSVPVDGFNIYKRTAEGFLKGKVNLLEFSPDLEDRYDTIKGAIDFFSDWI